MAKLKAGRMTRNALWILLLSQQETLQLIILMFYLLQIQRLVQEFFSLLV